MHGAAARRVPTLAFVVVVATIAAGGGCSLGFDTFNPVAGGQDGGPGPGEGGPPVDSGVTGVDSSSGDDSGEPGTDTGVAEDSSAPETGAMDAGCPGTQACLSTASSCGMLCAQAYTQCTSMCMGGNQQQCRNACRTTEQMCRTPCVQACDTCVTQGGAGCTDNQGCTAAAQM